MDDTSMKDFSAILQTFAEEAKNHKKEAFSLLWVIDDSSMAFVSAANGELKTTMRAKKPGAELYEYRFKDYNEFLIAFSRLEFILEQVLSLMVLEKPTAQELIRVSKLIYSLGFDRKWALVKEIQPLSIRELGDTKQRLQELRNNLAHNPVPVGMYGSEGLDTPGALKKVEEDFSYCFNSLVDLYESLQGKLRSVLG